MGLFSRNKPKIKVKTSKKDSFSGWIKCTECAELVHAQELQKSFYCCPKCGHHYRLSVNQRIELLADEGSFEELFKGIKPCDPLSFVDTESYKERIEKAQEKTGREDAVVVGIGKIESITVAMAIMDFSFMGGSMGSVVGEKLTLLIELAITKNLPLVIVSASGGARMQESILSLMQMAKTSGALAKFHEKGLFYLSLLTNPTTGGVTASFATLGDIILAEPEALIAFAGPRVVEQTIGEKLPPNAQKSEFLLEKGMIDAVVKRPLLKKRIAFFLRFFAQEKTKEPIQERLRQRLKDLLRLAEENAEGSPSRNRS